MSLANSLYENPTMPRRKILLSVGANNYRPPMERSKSAPKLMAIEEAVGEEDEENLDELVENGQNNRSPSSHNNANPLFSTTMTMGRKRTKTTTSLDTSSLSRAQLVLRNARRLRCVSFDDENSKFDVFLTSKCNDDLALHQTSNEYCGKEVAAAHVSVEDDEFNSLLMVNDYESSLSGELMSYFDSKLKLKTAQSECELNSRSNADDQMNMSDLATATKSRAAISLDNLDVLADVDDAHHFAFNKYNSTNSFYDDENENNTFYNQNEIIDCLVNVSKAKSMELIERNNKTNMDASSGKCDVESIKTEGMVRQTIAALNSMVLLDSDEGSITSGCSTNYSTSCETSSTVTTADDLLKPPESETNDATASPSTTTKLQIHRNKPNKLISSTSFHQARAPPTERQHINTNNDIDHNITTNNNDEDCSSEISDESGFDEFQNYIGKRSSFSKSEQQFINKNSISDNNKNCNQQDANNNSNNNSSKCFSSNTKATGRLMINIPKNAKSILI